ncbi:COR domain-containing protein [Rhizocola hellebori]|nr:COR domain-containing protein [Rhizocola hellebori]
MANAEVETALDIARQTGVFKCQDRDLRELPSALRRLPHLTEIHLADCRIRQLPDWLAEKDVVALSVLHGEFTRFPDIVCELTALKHLSISGCNVKSIPSTISKLRDLRQLTLSDCGLSEIPMSIADMENLLELDLGGNQLALGPHLELPFNLIYLSLWGNNFTQMPESIASMRDLRSLFLSSRGSTPEGRSAATQRPMPSGPDSMNFIMARSGARQAIESLPEWLFHSCRRLDWLDLSGNALHRIPREISELRSLRVLLLGGNAINEAPVELFDLPNLRELELSDNRLTLLHSQIRPRRQLKYLGLEGNPLNLPPEVVAAATTNPAMVFEYLRQVRASRRALDEAKLLVVGEGAVGKTSLIRRLVGSGFDEDERKTEGIDVTQWQVTPGGKDTRLNIWDFGGQEIMHATHQFFLTRRSVYLLVLDARQGEEQNRIDYWLKLIHSFSGGSPVIVVGNKCERITLDVDQRGLRAKYPNIVAFIETSCATDSGIETLQQTISETVDELSHVRDLLPTSFFEIKRHLEGLDANYLTFERYQRLCIDHGVDSETAQELLIGFLHDLGTVLCFRDDPRLRDTNILNPRWVTGGVYRILNSHAAAQLKGLLRWPDIEEILRSDDYRPDKLAFVLDMMRKFELCYESEQTYLIPDLLTKEEPDTGDWADALRFVVEYDVLPTSVIGRLIVRMQTFISHGTVWRTGAVLAMDDNRALVKADSSDGRLTILVSGPPNGRRGLLTAIRAQLKAIELTIPGIVSEELVPVPGNNAKSVPYSHLLRLESAGHRTVIPQGLTTEYFINDLLQGVEERTARAGVIVRGDDPVANAEAVPSPASEAPGQWSVKQSLWLGACLLITLLIVFGGYAFASAKLGIGVALALAGTALVVVVVIGLFVLRSAGRISESGFVDALKHAVDNRASSEPK